jgi:hypothetical protein
MDAPMTPHRARSPRSRLPALARAAGRLVCVAALASACGEGPAARGEAPAPAREGSAGAVDWSRRTVSLDPAGWSLEFCEGEGPFLCVARGSEPVGSVELLRVAVHDYDVLARVLGRGGSEREALEAGAAEFVAVLAADGRIGFGADHHLQADPPAPATVVGKPGIRLVLEDRLAQRVLRRIVQYRAIEGDTFYLLSATGTEGGGPLGEFAIEDLKAFEPVFGEIAAASRVSPTPP